MKPTDTIKHGPIARPKLKFKHHGSPPGTGCSQPLGICISIPFKVATSPITDEEIEDGFGTADFQVRRSLLAMEFHREAALPDGTIRIDYDKKVEKDLANALGFTSVTLKAGVYEVDLTSSEFGVCLVRITKGRKIIL